MEIKAAKAAKIIFIISFLPAAAILLYAFYGLFFDVEVLFGYESGTTAFRDVILLFGLVFTCYIPVLPICLVYQIIYILRLRLCNKKPQMAGVGKMFAVTGIAAAVIIGIAAFPTIRYYVQDYAENSAAQKMYYKYCDERIDYNTNVQQCGGVMGIKGQEHNCIMVDHDRHRIGFIACDRPEYHEIMLTDAAENTAEAERIKSEYYVQSVFPLEKGRLITFCTGPENSHRTIAMLLEYNDGTVYYASALTDKDTGYEIYLGLDRSQYYSENQLKYDEAFVEAP